MIRLRNTNRVVITGRLAVVILFVALLAGCSDDDSPPPPAPTVTATVAPPATQTPTPSGNADLGAACQKLAGCDQCFTNQYGRCLGNDDCVQRLSADTAICINALSGCNQQALGDCLFLGCNGTDATGECG